MAGIPHRYRSQPAIRPGDGHHRNVRVHLRRAVAAIGIRAPPVDRHAGEALPRVSEKTTMPDVFHEMSKKGLGMTTVLQADGRLAGIITDGDLRRLMEKHRGVTLEMSAGMCMTRGPQTIGPHVLASEALNAMERRKITSIVVVDEAGGVLGVVHLHDLWGLELI